MPKKFTIAFVWKKKTKQKKTSLFLDFFLFIYWLWILPYKYKITWFYISVIILDLLMGEEKSSIITCNRKSLYCPSFVFMSDAEKNRHMSVLYHDKKGTCFNRFIVILFLCIRGTDWKLPTRNLWKSWAFQKGRFYTLWCPYWNLDDLHLLQRKILFR